MFYKLVLVGSSGVAYFIQGSVGGKKWFTPVISKLNMERQWEPTY